MTDWIFCHYKGLIFKIGPGVEMFYVEKGTGRGAVEGGSRKAGESRSRQEVICVYAHM